MFVASTSHKSGFRCAFCRYSSHFHMYISKATIEWDGKKASRATKITTISLDLSVIIACVCVCKRLSIASCLFISFFSFLPLLICCTKVNHIVAILVDIYTKKIHNSIENGPFHFKQIEGSTKMEKKKSTHYIKWMFIGIKK